MSNEALFIEQRPDGRYDIKPEKADRASAVCDTQEQAIERARKMTTGDVRVERVRDTYTGSRDKWRKV